MKGKIRPTASSATDQDFSIKKLSIVPEECSREGPSAEIETDLQRDKHCESQYYELAEHELKNALIDVFVATNNRPLSLDQIRNDPPYSLQLIITKLKLKKQIVLWPYFLKAHHDTFMLKEKEFNLLNSFYEKARRENCIRSATFDYSQVSPANKFAMHPNVKQTVKEQSNKDRKKEKRKENPVGSVFLPESEQKGQEKKQEEQKVGQSETMKQCKQKNISKQQEEKKNENPEKSKTAVKRKEKRIRLLESHLKQSLCDFLARNPGSHLISKVANVDEVRAARNDLETRTSQRLRWRPFFKKHSDTFVISGFENPGLESVALCKTASLSKLFVENSKQDTRQKQVESKNENPKFLKESSVEIVQKTKTQKQENEISVLPEVISEYKQKGLVNKQVSEKGGKLGNSETLHETECTGIPNEKQEETLQRKEKNVPKQQEERKIPENSEIALNSKERRIKLLESQLKQILFNFLENDSGSHLLSKVANVEEIRAITNALGTLASQRFKWKPFLKKQSDTFVISGLGNPGLESVSLYGTASGSAQCLQSGVVRVNEISSTDLRPDAFKLFEELGQICTSMGFSKPVKISTEEFCGAFATVVSLNERTIGSSVNVDLNCSQAEALKYALEWLTGLTT